MNFMWLIWIGLFFELLILTFLKPIITDFESIQIISVSIHMLFTTIVLLGNKSKFRMLFFGAFFTRIAFMIWDFYAREIYILPNSGGDSEGFKSSAIAISNDISLLSEQIYGGFYTKILGTLFYGIGPQPLLGHYFNVLLGISVIYILLRILVLLDIQHRTINIILLIAAFFPTSMILSAIFLREMFITFFVVISLYLFIKWFNAGKYINMVLSFLMLGLASMFHSGVIGIFIGYAFVLLFYQRRKKKYQFTLKTVFSFLIIVVVIVLITTQYSDVFLGKFNEVEGIDDIYSTASRSVGGSAYLTGVTIDNPIELIIYGPIKAFYFLTAPLPMNWRGLGDIFTFITDSMLYLGTMIYFLINFKRFKSRNTLIYGLVVIIISVALIFGIGVGNAGTAMRHRQKLIALILLLLAVMIDGKRKNK